MFAPARTDPHLPTDQSYGHASQLPSAGVAPNLTEAADGHHEVLAIGSQGLYCQMGPQKKQYV